MTMKETSESVYMSYRRPESIPDELWDAVLQPRLQAIADARTEWYTSDDAYLKYHHISLHAFPSIDLAEGTLIEFMRQDRLIVVDWRINPCKGKRRFNLNMEVYIPNAQVY